MLPSLVQLTYQYSCTPARLWSALTDPMEMRQWYFEMIPDFKAEIGFKTEFLVENEGRKFPHVWEIKEVIPNKRLGHDWWFTGYEGMTYVLFELAEKNGGTELNLSCSGLETLPQDIPEFKSESCQGGWEYFLKERLKEYIDRVRV